MKKQGSPHLVMTACAEGRVELVTTQDLVVELQRALTYPRVARQLHEDDREDWATLLHQIARIVTATGSATGAVQRDPDDDQVLEAAIAGAAEYIVTGDQDLLTIGTYAGIEIVTPARFVEILEERELR